MKFALPKLLLVCALFVTRATPAAEIDDVSLASGLSYGYGLESRSTMQAILTLSPALELAWTPRTALVASARIWLDAENEVAPGRPLFDTYTRASRPLALGDSGNAQLRDVYLEVRSDNGIIRLGKQQIVWGRLDGIKVLDVVDPQDFREFITEDFSVSRISLWSAYLDYDLGNWRTEIAVVPDSTGHAIPGSGAWFELTAPRFRYGAQPGQNLPLETVEPEMTLEQTALGLRLSRRLGAMEISAVAYSGMDPEPLGRFAVSGGQAVVERFYERRDVYGISFDVGLGMFVLRGEYAYQPGRVFNTRPNGELRTIALDEHRGALGVDFNGPLGVFVNVQYLLDTIPDAPADLVRPETDRIGTLYLRKTFGYDALSLEARWYYSFTDEDQMLSFGVDYALGENTSLVLAAQTFHGTPDGIFGEFTGRDRVVLGLSTLF